LPADHEKEDPVSLFHLDEECPERLEVRDAVAIHLDDDIAGAEAGGGGVARRRIEVVTDQEGALLEMETGGRRRPASGDAVASILAEAMLAATPDGERRCLQVEDAETGRAGQACATRRGSWLEGEVLGETVRFRSAAGGLPDEVWLPSQGTRFFSDAGAAVPSRAPATFGSAVPAPPGAETERAITFCGLAPFPEDPSPPPSSSLTRARTHRRRRT
jgi:hypothetical protein